MPEYAADKMVKSVSKAGVSSTYLGHRLNATTRDDEVIQAGECTGGMRFMVPCVVISVTAWRNWNGRKMKDGCGMCTLDQSPSTGGLDGRAQSLSTEMNRVSWVGLKVHRRPHQLAQTNPAFPIPKHHQP